MLVHELMTTDVITVRVDTQVKQALSLLDRHNITSTPVIDPQDRVVGVVSEADLLRASVLHDPRAHLTPVVEAPRGVARYVGDVMTRQAVVIEPDADVAEAVDLMTSTAMKRPPVVDDRQRLVGMISRHDVVHRGACRRPDHVFRGRAARPAGIELDRNRGQGSGDRARSAELT
jgi:CBS domain-containing protein